MSQTDDLRRHLERLGVQLGTSGLRPPKDGPGSPGGRGPRRRESIADWVSGLAVEGPAGACFLSETRYSLAHVHGALAVGELLQHGLTNLEVLAGELGEPPADFRRFVFLDTETTGLAGGTGTYAFLVGLGTFEGDEFVVRQYFMRDIPEEPAMLSLVREVLEPGAGLVSFNGRAFDWPLLETRFAMNRQPVPRMDGCHLDLLLPARRLWRLRLESCALSSLEEHVLGLQRSSDDVPGWAIPGLYRDYLVWGRAEPMRRVFYHNAHDILSLVTLAALLCASLCEPLRALTHGEDLFSLGRRFEAEGDADTAAQLYQQCLRCQLPAGMRPTVMRRLSRVHRRAGRSEEAVTLWQSLARRGDLEACIALAKHYEHRVRDLAQARSQALRALRLLQQLRYPDPRKLAEIEHRLQRLERKSRRARELAEGS